MKKLFQALLVACLYITVNTVQSGVDITLNKSDPGPLSCTNLPIAFAYENYKEAVKEGHSHSGSGITISAMPFYSKASKGTSINGAKNTELKDLDGRWNLLAALGTTAPNGQTVPTILGSAITGTDTLLAQTITAMAHANTSITYASGKTPTEFTTLAGLKSMQGPEELFGFLTIPTKYRKHGARFEVTGAMENGFGFSVGTGISSISQSANFNNAISFGSVDITSKNDAGTSTTTTVDNAAYYVKNGANTLVVNPFSVTKASDQNWYDSLKALKTNTADQINNIADVIGIDLCNFHETGFEDLRGELFWRKALKLDTKETTLFIPFATLFGTMDLGDTDNPDVPLSLPFGNNGHKSIGGSAGFTLDFADSFEIGAAIGGATYSTRTVQNMRMPNATDQSGIYPFKTAAYVNPGSTWYVSLLMNSFHFEEDLSFYMQYLYVNHSKDRINLVNADAVFKPKVLECKSLWSNHMANVGLNYDVSPGVSIGCAAQIPLKQKNSYRSSTFSVSIMASH